MKDQIDSLSEGTTKGHIKTVVSIDSYVVDGASCADKKAADEDTDDDNTGEETEETKAAKKEIEIAKREAE